MHSLPIYVINLENSRDRLSNVEEQCADVDSPLTVVRAIDGRNQDFSLHQYTDLFSVEKRSQVSRQLTTFACYLSHAKCWETLLKSNETHALIIEDDICLHRTALSNLDIEACQESFDVIFVNSRTHRWTDRSAAMKFSHRIRLESKGRQTSKTQRRFRNVFFKLLSKLLPQEKFVRDRSYVSVSEVILRRIKQGYYRHKMPACGGDGYILSRQGAEKLLSIMHSRKINDIAVDHSIQFHSLSSEARTVLRELPVSSKPEILNQFLEREKNAVPIELKSYIYVNGPVVSQGKYSNASNIRDVKLYR